MQLGPRGAAGAWGRHSLDEVLQKQPRVVQDLQGGGEGRAAALSAVHTGHWRVGMAEATEAGERLWGRRTFMLPGCQPRPATAPRGQGHLLAQPASHPPGSVPRKAPQGASRDHRQEGVAVSSAPSTQAAAEALPLTRRQKAGISVLVRVRVEGLWPHQPCVVGAGPPPALVLCSALHASPLSPALQLLRSQDCWSHPHKIPAGTGPQKQGPPPGHRVRQRNLLGVHP